MMTDAEFVREVQAYEKTLYRVSRTILSSDADCCDAVQEALTRAWKHRNDVNPRFLRHGCCAFLSTNAIISADA